MALAAQIRDHYSHPSGMTALAQHAHALQDLPHGVGEVARIVQGILLHEHWAPAYRVELTKGRRAESHIRSVSHMLAQALAHDARALTFERPLDKRLVGVCRHFAVLTVAMLRAQHIPARARCGFGSYFKKGSFEDHWVVEYWNEGEDRWMLADTQIDALQVQALRPDFALLDVPRDRFVIAGDAWLRCRADEADPNDFGIFDMRGLWFIAGNVVRDFASLNNMEMLPWDVWGAMSDADRPFESDILKLVDRVAALTLESDTHFSELGALYGNDERLRVPSMVFNALTRRLESV